MIIKNTPCPKKEKLILFLRNLEKREPGWYRQPKEPDWGRLDSVCEVAICHLGISLLHCLSKANHKLNPFFFFQILSFLFFNLFFKQTQFLLKSRTVPFENQSVGVFYHPLFTCESVFHFCDQIPPPTPTPKKINLKEESFILAPGFRDFCPWLAGAFVLGTVVKQNFPTEGNGR